MVRHCTNCGVDLRVVGLFLRQNPRVSGRSDFLASNITRWTFNRVCASYKISYIFTNFRQAEYLECYEWWVVSYIMMCKGVPIVSSFFSSSLSLYLVIIRLLCFANKLIAYIRVLEQLDVTRLFETFPAFYGTKTFVSFLIRARFKPYVIFSNMLVSSQSGVVSLLPNP